MKTNFSGPKRRKRRSVFASAAILAVICVFLGASDTSAQGPAANSNASSHESERATQVRALNNSILQLHGQVQENSATPESVRGQASNVLAKRAAALQALITEDPKAALSFAFSAELLTDLAAKFPGSATQLESHGTWQGAIEHWVSDNFTRKQSLSVFRLHAGAQTLDLHFGGREPDLTISHEVRVTGVMLADHVAVMESTVVQPDRSRLSIPVSETQGGRTSFLFPARWSILFLLLSMLSAYRRHFLMATRRVWESGARRVVYVVACVFIVSSSSVGLAQTNACSTTGVQNTLVLLGIPSGVTPPITPQQVSNVFFDTTSGHSLNGYWQEASSGQTSASGTVYGWYTLTGSYSCSTLSQMFSDTMNAAAAAGVNFQNYTRIFFVFPDFSPSCGWEGFAQVGCYSLSTPSGTINSSTAYVMANNLIVRDSGVGLLAHEGGHELGLKHAGSLSYGQEALGAVGSPGTFTAYGDWFSTMGSATLALYSAPHRAEDLGWMSSGSNFQVVQNSGTFVVHPLEGSPSGLQALKVQRGTGNSDWLWLEYRQPIGNYDTSLFGVFSEVYSGALVHYEDPSTGAFTQLLDFTPNDGSWYNPALAAGQSWTDPYSNVSLSVQSATPTGLTLNVDYGAVLCSSAAPTVVVSPLNPSVYPGQSVGYTATVTNNDSSGCPASNINLGSTEPSGWSTSLSSSAVSLQPGQSISLTLGKGAPSGTPAGTYAVNLSAVSNSATSTGLANATVVTPPSVAVSLSVPAASFSRPGIVPITASANNGGVPASGVSVTFTVTTPTGSTATLSGTTGTNGTATWSYKLNSRSAAGLYSVSAQITTGSGSKKVASSILATSNNIMFSVQ